MKKEEVMNSIKAIISDVTEIPVEEISSDKSLMDDLDMSSLEILTIIADLEKEFKLTIPEKALRTFENIENITDYIMENK